MQFFKRHLSKIVLFIAVSFIIAGIAMNEPVRIFDHAIRICLGCIGIG